MNQIFSAPIPSWADPESYTPPRDLYGPVTSGFYAAIIINSEERRTLANVRYWAFTYMLVGGEHAGKKIDDIFHVHDHNPEVRDSEFRRLNNLCRACNIAQIRQSREMYGLPIELTVFTQGRTTIVASYESPHSLPYRTANPQSTRWRTASE